MKKSLSRGLEVQASYTFGKSIDTGSNSFSDDEYQTTVADPYPFNRALNKGLSDFDVRHSLVLNFLSDVPAPRGWSGPANWILSGWRLGGIYTFSSGEPFTVLLAADRAGTKSSQSRQTLGERPNFVDAPGCGDPVTGNPNQWVNTSCFAFPAAGTLGDLGRNALSGPGISELDVSLVKSHDIPRISEHFKVQFRAEWFNALNHANFLPPSVTTFTIFNASGALIGNPTQLTATSTTSRQLQLVVKLIF